MAAEEAKDGVREPWPMKSKYRIGGILGKGTYGVVYAAEVLATGQQVVVKRIRDESSKGRPSGVPATALREVSVLRELRHENIVRLQAVECCADNVWFLVFERLDCDLATFVHKHPDVGRKTGKRGLETPRLKRWLYQVLRGLEHCHSHGVLHRDLKPQNILVDCATMTLKLADFGLARAIVPPISQNLSPTVVTLWYRCPEILLGAPTYSPAVDVWSVGVIFAELSNGRPLWPHEHQIELLLSIFHDLGTPKLEEWPDMSSLPYHYAFPKFAKPDSAVKALVPHLDDQGVDLMRRMLQANPRDRISARAALRHPWFDAVRDEARGCGARGETPSSSLAEAGDSWAFEHSPSRSPGSRVASPRTMSSVRRLFDGDSDSEDSGDEPAGRDELAGRDEHDAGDAATTSGWSTAATAGLTSVGDGGSAHSVRDVGSASMEEMSALLAASHITDVSM